MYGITPFVIQWDHSVKRGIPVLNPMESEKALLVGLRLPNVDQGLWKDAFDELGGLVETAGAQVVCSVIQVRDRPDAATYIGSGKVDEVHHMAEAHGCNLIVFDAELSPGHIRNLSDALPYKILDRTQIIIDIFAGRAQTKESKLQVELAQLQYLLPRLTGAGREMSRLGGGIGTRGPGETKLETDRRRIRQRISDLRHEIKEVANHRHTQRARRAKRNVPVIALVGYTNAGKTSLLHYLQKRYGSGGKPINEGKNRLFDTLDPLTRRISLPGQADLIVTDTVGFIRQLPHTLIDAFRSTLEETLEADLLVHVVDASHPQADVMMNTVYQVLHEIGADTKPILTLFNKSDRVIPSEEVPFHDERATHTIYVSARTGEGIEEWIDWLQQWIETSD